MLRLTWRLSRPNLAVCAAILLAFGVFAVLTERAMASYVHTSGIDSCVSATQDCRSLGDTFRDKFGGVLQAYQWFGFVPVLIGAFWGGPLIAREIEQGTHRLAWTQSVGRGRWLATKIAVYLLGAVILSAILTWVMVWWLQPMQHVQGGGTVGPSAADRISPNVFSFEGIAPVAYTVFAFAVGAAAGVVLKKVVPAILATLVLYAPLRIAMAQKGIRGYLVTPDSVTYPAGAVSPRAGAGDWVLEHNLVDAAGRPISYDTISAACPNDITTACAPSGARFVDRYQGLDRFWTLQAVEAGVFIGVAVLCLAFAAWWTLRRAS
jgi:hypothetical protein